MCGIVGYKGGRDLKSVVLGGLKRLEYRGYDSAGIAYFDGGKIKLVRSVGKISGLEEKLADEKIDSHSGIGHTRWATHGSPSEKNSHPHMDCNKRIALVHNGIIENYKELRKMLVKKGHKFLSDTDTEALTHLIEENYHGDLRAAVEKSLQEVVGTYGICVISADQPDIMIGARKGSPLIVGVGSDEFYIASDVAAILSHTNRVIYLEDGEIATIKGKELEVTDLKRKQKVKEVSKIEWDLESIEKGGYEHFMLKEIYEQPDSLENTLRGRISKEDVHLGGPEYP